MFTYLRFYRAKNWHPRWVDRLFMDEEYWLPVMEEAFDAAAATWAEISAKRLAEVACSG